MKFEAMIRETSMDSTLFINGQQIYPLSFEISVKGGDITRVFLEFGGEEDSCTTVTGYLVDQRQFEEFERWQKVHGHMPVDFELD